MCPPGNYSTKFAIDRSFVDVVCGVLTRNRKQDSLRGLPATRSSTACSAYTVDRMLRIHGLPLRVHGPFSAASHGECGLDLLDGSTEVRRRAICNRAPMLRSSR